MKLKWMVFGVIMSLMPFFVSSASSAAQQVAEQITKGECCGRGNPIFSDDSSRRRSMRSRHQKNKEIDAQEKKDDEAKRAKNKDEVTEARVPDAK